MSQVSGEKMAILSSRLHKIVEKMASTLFRSSRSTIINTARDFSCCLVSAGNEIVDVAESLPIQGMGGPELSTAHMVSRHPVLRRGDAFLHNSPYHGAGHAADLQVMVPIFDGAGRHRLTAIAKAHMADIGNALPTTINTAARDVYEEGALLFPSVRIQRDYTDIDDILAMCDVRVRSPIVWRGDYMAMLGAARTAEREIEALASQVGWDLLDAHIRRWLDYSEQLMIDAIAALPAGKARQTTYHDALPGLAAAVPITVEVECRPEEGRIIIDLSDNPDCLPTGLNLTEATAIAAARMGAYCAIPARLPCNSGAFRRLDIRLRENCCVGIPRHPASCSAATTSFTGRVAGLVQAVIAELGDGVGMAEHGVTAGGIVPIAGGNPRRGGEVFVDVLAVAWGNGGGGPAGDGRMFDHSATGGVAYRSATETCELQMPVCIWTDRLEIDTAAPGQFRGAAAHRFEWSPIDTAVSAVWVGEGSEHPARGVRGGGNAVPNAVTIIRADGRRETPAMSGMTVLQPGDRYSSLSGGGGGYGPPSRRARGQIEEDIAEGIVSPERALADYGYTK